MAGQTGKISPWGLALTVLALAGFLWGAWFLLKGSGNPTDMMENQILAWKNLEKIRAAQKAYQEAGPGQDGKKEYARFYIHLWQAVGSDGSPVKTRLISRDLAFAMAPGQALDGYYYQDIHQCGPGLNLDYENQWMVAALPLVPGQTGETVFVAAPSGVFAARPDAAGQGWPCDLGASDWAKVQSRSDL